MTFTLTINLQVKIGVLLIEVGWHGCCLLGSIIAKKAIDIIVLNVCVAMYMHVCVFACVCGITFGQNSNQHMHTFAHTRTNTILVIMHSN